MAATAWYGLRAAKAAVIGSRCVRIRRASDNAEQDFVSVTGGGADTVAITAFLSGTTGTVVTLYDQTGNGNNVTQATAGSQPAFTLSGIGSLPVLTYSGSNGLSGVAVSSDISVPYTVSAVAKDTSGASPDVSIALAGSNGDGMYLSGVNGILTWSGAGNVRQPASSGNYHSLQTIHNGAVNSTANVDGTSSAPGNAGTDVFAWNTGGNNGLNVGWYASGSNQLTGSIAEVGVWPIAFSSTNSSNVSANQHAYWGF